MIQEFIKNDDFFSVIHLSDFGFPMDRAEVFVTVQNLLNLNRIVGERFGAGIDGRQAATDHPGRKPDLHVGEGGFLRSTGKLKPHQEIRCFSNTPDEVVLKIDQGRLAGA